MNKKTKQKFKIINLLLAICLVVGLLPAYAFADENDDSAINSVADSLRSENNDNVVIYTADSGEKRTVIWTDGIVAPELRKSETEPGDFKKENTIGYTTYYALTKHGSGWYDVNKAPGNSLQLENRIFNDSGMCFAGVSANQLYWWMAQNKNNIEQYLNTDALEDSKKNELVRLMDSYVGDSDGDRSASALYKDFCEKFPVVIGGYSYNSNLINDYFINGNRPVLGGYTTVKNSEVSPTGGFFRPVFGENFLTQRIPTPTYERFQEQMLERMRAGDSVAIIHNAATAGVTHIITVWGAELDKNNRVVALYTSDTDNQEDYAAAPNSNDIIGMKRISVYKDNQGNARYTAKDNAASENPQVGPKVHEIISLSLGTQQWENWLSGGSQGGSTTSGPEILTVAKNNSAAQFSNFDDALAAAKSGDTIQFVGDAGAASDSNNDVPLIIDKEICIEGIQITDNDGKQRNPVFSLRYSGIVLGADVTFKNLTVDVASTFGNAIFANGHELILDSVCNATAVGTTPNALFLFCGRADNENWTNLPNTGDNGQIIIKGKSKLADIFAGNLSNRTGAGGQHVSKFNGNSTVKIAADDDSIIGNIYACGAYEPTGSGNNAIEPNSDAFPVEGNIAVNLSNSVIKTVYGFHKADVTYDGISNYTRSCRLLNVKSLTVDSNSFSPGFSNAKGNLYNADVVVKSGAKLDLQDIEPDGFDDDIKLKSWSGEDGKLVLGQDQKITVTGTVNGTTKVAVGEFKNDSNSWGTPKENHLYISANNAAGTEFDFVSGTNGKTPVWSEVLHGWQVADITPPSTGSGDTGSATNPPNTGNGNTGSATNPPSTGSGDTGSATNPPSTGSGNTGSATNPPSTGSGDAGSATNPPSTGSGNTGSAAPSGGGGGGAASLSANTETSVQKENYVVHRLDTLYTMATKKNYTIAEIAAANKSLIKHSNLAGLRFRVHHFKMAKSIEELVELNKDLIYDSNLWLNIRKVKIPQK